MFGKLQIAIALALRTPTGVGGPGTDRNGAAEQESQQIHENGCEYGSFYLCQIEFLSLSKQLENTRKLEKSTQRNQEVQEAPAWCLPLVSFRQGIWVLHFL